MFHIIINLLGTYLYMVHICPHSSTHTHTHTHTHAHIAHLYTHMHTHCTQAAHVGVGISGREGLQATLASDYSISQVSYWIMTFSDYNICCHF